MKPIKRNKTLGRSILLVAVMASTVWRGYITFGLISIPVRLFRAARSERVKLKHVYRVPVVDDRRSREYGPSKAETPELDEETDFSFSGNPVESSPDRPVETVIPVRRQFVSSAGIEHTAPEAELTKGYEVEKDRYVTLDQSELKALEPKTATEMELLEFVRLADVDPVFFETSYYVKPDNGGEKPYALLYESLRQSELVAVGRLAMHRREHITLVRSGKSGLIAHTMYFATEVRADQEYHADKTLVTTKELTLANTLVKSLAGTFQPSNYRDTYREQLEQLINQKAAGTVAMVAKRSSHRAPTVDIMEALKKSLAQLKKPPSGTTAAGRTSSPKRVKRG
jgi:DNA end-binding protein Ku